MSSKILGLAVIALLSGCAQSPQATKVVNRADIPLLVTYVASDGAAPRTLRINAGETRALGQGYRLPDYVRVEFRDASRNVVFRDVDPGWREARCVSDCAFIWYGDGRVGITA